MHDSERRKVGQREKNLSLSESFRLRISNFTICQVPAFTKMLRLNSFKWDKTTNAGTAVKYAFF